MLVTCQAEDCDVPSLQKKAGFCCLFFVRLWCDEIHVTYVVHFVLI